MNLKGERIGFRNNIQKDQKFLKPILSQILKIGVAIGYADMEFGL